MIDDPENWRSWLTPVEAPAPTRRAGQRVGLMGSRPLGIDYMPGVNQRANRLRCACRDQGEVEAAEAVDPRQGRLPGF